MQVKNMERKAYCQYVCDSVDDSGTEALYVYLPIAGGFAQYSFVHAEIPAKQCDVWRMGPVFACDTNFQRKARLTRAHAEWEMALRLQDRPDFIGGAAHGDEIGRGIVCWIDGKEIAVSGLYDMTPFETLSLSVDSIGYDPASPSEAVLHHQKHFTIDAVQVQVSQKVEWLQDVALSRSYMAMMPPLKEVTDCYRIGQSEYLPIAQRSFSESGRFDWLTLRGADGFTFEMRVNRYLSENGENTCLITDNGGDSYHKMYFVLAHGGQANQGDIWETETVYRIYRDEMSAIGS